MADGIKVKEPTQISGSTELASTDELYIIHNGETYTGTLEDIIKVVTKSTINAADPLPVNASAVNGALASLSIPIKYRQNQSERDFNTCIPPVGKREIYFIPVANQSNAPIPNYNWILEVDNKNVIPTVSSEYRISQLATAYSGANPDIKYTRNGSSNDGITWTWGNWQKLTTNTDLNNALTDYAKKTNYTYCKSNDIVKITDSPSLTEDKYYLLQEFSVTWQGIQKIEILLGYDANYEKTRVILTLDNRYANNPRVISYYDSPQGLNYVDFFVSNDGNKTYLYARGFKGKNYITFIILDRNFSLKSNYNVPSNSYIGNVIHTVSTNGGKIVTERDLSNYSKILQKGGQVGSGSFSITLESNKVYEFIGGHSSGGIADYLITTNGGTLNIVAKSTSNFISTSVSGLTLTITNQYTISYAIISY